MDIFEKLEILADSAKYDVACTSSGTSRAAVPGKLGSAVNAGICHSFSGDGRCISLLKILLTNFCIYDCQYCVNRRSNDVRRAMFLPSEIAELMMNFYRRNYIEGLFLSSAIVKSPDYTMELLYQTLSIVRNEYKFNGYIHVKAIPGASRELITQTGYLADRMSVNIELPSEVSLNKLAPDKSREAVLAPMQTLQTGIAVAKNEIALYRHAPKFVPAGQSTQMIVGATPETDSKIINLSQGLYKKFKLKRVFYSAYIPVHKGLVNDPPPLLREHRLYQADWLMRFYNFSADEIIPTDSNLNLNMDPKCQWALNHIEAFPVEVNRADYFTLLRVPGLGVTSARRIITNRHAGVLTFDGLKKMGVSLKRAQYFITCNGKMYDKITLDKDYLTRILSEKKIDEGYEQLKLGI